MEALHRKLVRNRSCEAQSDRGIDVSSVLGTSCIDSFILKHFSLETRLSHRLEIPPIDSNEGSIDSNISTHAFA